jgi:hypothetical protein
VLREKIAAFLGSARVPARIKVVTDTTDFYRVDFDDILELGGRHYLIRHYEREGRFGIDEQPKFWVRRAVDLGDGSLKVIKMVFHERFQASYGGMVFECVRSSAKEGRILELTSGHPRFMQGATLPDSAGNPVRVLDYIKGPPFAEHVMGLRGDHEEYYFRHLPGLLGEFIELAGAIGFLHGLGQTHGDIRRDHIIRDRRSGLFRWVDFDYSCLHSENQCAYDLAGLGNVLLFLVGGGDVTAQQLGKENSPVLGLLEAGDMNIIFRNRVANLRKVYPYISEDINYILMHFSGSARVYYRATGALMEDLREALGRMKKESL